jgi:hypothetical protein
MKKYVLIYTLFLIFVFCTSCKGQNKTALPKNNTKSENKDALISYGPSSVTRAIKQDRNGNIWIASWDGVFRYDGKSFTNITSEVSSARFFSVLEDRKGNFWFGTIGSGVYYYDGKSFQNFTTKDGLFNNEINCIYEDKTGNIWLGVNGGASCYDGMSFRNYMMNGDVVNEDKTGKSFPDIRPPKSVKSIIEDKTGKLWFGTKDNAFVYDGKTFTVVTNKGKPFTNVSIIEDKKGNIWLGGEGLWRYDGSTFTNFSHNYVLYVYEDRNGNIWTSSTIDPSDQNWVLYRYEAKSLDNEKPTVTEIKRQVGAIFCILEAYDGSIWFGSNGAYRYDGKTIQEFKSKELQK